MKVPTTERRKFFLNWTSLRVPLFVWKCRSNGEISLLRPHIHRSFFLGGKLRRRDSGEKMAISRASPNTRPKSQNRANEVLIHRDRRWWVNIYGAEHFSSPDIPERKASSWRKRSFYALQYLSISGWLRSIYIIAIDPTTPPSPAITRHIYPLSFGTKDEKFRRIMHDSLGSLSCSLISTWK